MCNKLRRQHGLTIVELVIFIVIVGVAAAGILQVMNFSNRYNTDPIRRKQAMLIAEAYMEEVQQAQFTACDPADDNAATAISSADCASANYVEKFGPEQGNARPFDNINDYVPANYILGTTVRAFAQPDAAGNLIDRDVAGNPLGANAAGAALGNMSLNNIATTLTLRDASGLIGKASPADPKDIDALQITITVRYGTSNDDVVVLDGYRTRYAPQVR